MTVHGIPDARVSLNVKTSYVLPFGIMEGYVTTSKYDPDEDAESALGSATLDNLGRICFFPSADLIQTKYPEKLLVYGARVGCPRLNKKMIQKVERWKGPYDGFSQYGQPMFMDVAQAKLLSTRKPTYSCMEKYTEMPMYWVSYNPKLGQKELAVVCEAQKQPDIAEIDRLIEQGMFSVVIPAD
jgi:hypothetical protein